MNTWSTKVAGPTEDRALALADEQAADHFGETPHHRVSARVYNTLKDAAGVVLVVNVQADYAAT